MESEWTTLAPRTHVEISMNPSPGLVASFHTQGGGERAKRGNGIGPNSRKTHWDDMTGSTAVGGEHKKDEPKHSQGGIGACDVSVGFQKPSNALQWFRMLHKFVRFQDFEKAALEGREGISTAKIGHVFGKKDVGVCYFMKKGIKIWLP